METNTPRLIELLRELVSKTYHEEITWKRQDDNISYQYQGPKAAVVITSAGDEGEGPYGLIMVDTTGTETATLTEAEAPDKEPAAWNSSLSFLYALARRGDKSSTSELREALGLLRR